jgi:hypothetical protein
MKLLRIAGTFSARCTHLIDADSQVGVASVQRKFDGPYEVPPGHRTVPSERGGEIRLHKDCNNWVATLDRDVLTLEDVVVAIDAINYINGDELAFVMTPIQLRDMARGR